MKADHMQLKQRSYGCPALYTFFSSRLIIKRHGLSPQHPTSQKTAQTPNHKERREPSWPTKGHPVKSLDLLKQTSLPVTYCIFRESRGQNLERKKKDWNDVSTSSSQLKMSRGGAGNVPFFFLGFPCPGTKKKKKKEKVYNKFPIKKKQREKKSRSKGMLRIEEWGGEEQEGSWGYWDLQKDSPPPPVCVSVFIYTSSLYSNVLPFISLCICPYPAFTRPLPCSVSSC